MLGQPSSKFDYKVFYTKPTSSDTLLEAIIPIRWGDELDDEKLLHMKETCMVEVCKDGNKN